MHKLKTTIAALCIALFITACGKQPIESTQTNNSNIQVDTLFEKDGCTIYRFLDAGTYRYFARCDTGQHKTMWTESCGKGCQRHIDIPTN